MHGHVEGSVELLLIKWAFYMYLCQKNVEFNRIFWAKISGLSLETINASTSWPKLRIYAHYKIA